MKEGDVVLAALPQADLTFKARPALALRQMPPYGDWLLCGISSQLQQAAPGFDEVLSPAEPDFATSGLREPSVIRLGFLSAVPERLIKGRTGWVAASRHRRLLARLALHLSP